jgi:transcriptional regulatory protein RtcR
MDKKNVAIGLMGATLDMGKGPKRWERWRPTVDLCRHEELPIHRFELMYQRQYLNLAIQVQRDINVISPQTDVRMTPIEFRDVYDFEDVFGTLHEYAQRYEFEPDRENYLVHITTGNHVMQICLFLLIESHLIPGNIIQTRPPGVDDYGQPGPYTIIDLDLGKYDKIASRFKSELKDDVSFLKSGIETMNRKFNALIERIEQVAINSKEPILLMGPTGAGKSRLARRIYELKRARRQVSGAFVEVNCATVRGDAAMSALFGHVKGSFTGAVRDRAGLLRAADGGLLFLDEVAELGVDEQTMLLRALEEKVFFPMGSDAEVASNFQLICGTNRDLTERAQAGAFRDDLLARINLWTFYLPGLCDRPEDIEPNLDYELDQFYRLTGTRVTFSREARRDFLAFATSAESKWKANFRDLNGAIVRMSTLAPGGRITPEGVKEEIGRLLISWREAESGDTDEALLRTVLGDQNFERLDPFQRAQLAFVIRTCRRSKSLSEAGRRLFSISRQAKKNRNDADRLRKYLARFELTWNDLQEDGTIAARAAGTGENRGSSRSDK